MLPPLQQLAVALFGSAVVAASCGKSPVPADAGPVTTAVRSAEPSAHTRSKGRLALGPLVPPGNGWKCVYERCNRRCVYPTMARSPNGSGAVPPCNDQSTAFCVAHEASDPNPDYVLCFTDLAACEASRAQSGTFQVTNCEEK